MMRKSSEALHYCWIHASIGRTFWSVVISGISLQGRSTVQYVCCDAAALGGWPSIQPSLSHSAVTLPLFTPLSATTTPPSPTVTPPPPTLTSLSLTLPSPPLAYPPFPNITPPTHHQVASKYTFSLLATVCDARLCHSDVITPSSHLPNHLQPTLWLLT